MRRRSARITREDASIIKLLLKMGAYQHEIAARFQVNQGRVSEIRTGKRWRDVAPASVLPPGFSI